MSLSTISAAVVADGNVMVLAAPAASITDITAVTAAELAATGVKDITYDLTASGFSSATSQDAVDNERFTLPVVLQTPGRKHPTLSLQYVFGDPDDVADGMFVEGEDYIIAVRYGVDHATAPTAAQTWDFWPVKAGHAQKDAPAANANLSKTRAFYVTDIVREDQALL